MAPGIIIYIKDYQAVKELSDERLGALVRALFTGDLSGLDAESLMAYRFLKIKIDAQNAHYQEVSEKRRLAAMTRKQQQQPKEVEQQQLDKKVKKEAAIPTSWMTAEEVPQEVTDFFREIGGNDEASFYFYWQSNGWKRKGVALKNWKAAARTWVKNETTYNNKKENGKQQISTEFCGL